MLRAARSSDRKQALFFDNAGLGHFVVKVVTLTGTFTDTCEYRKTAVLFSDVVDKLHNKYGLTDTCTAEQTYLTALEVRCDKVYDLDTRFKYLC